jgi:hypothetical protein
MRGVRRGVMGVSVSLLAILACGYSRITTPKWDSPYPETPPQPPIVTIRSTGVEPQILHQTSARDVTFVNEDSRPHTLYGDLHPTHQGYAECSVVNAMGALQPGERRRIDEFPLGLCGYHDENDPENTAFRGYVVVH